jgi:hypothetical protein
VINLRTTLLILLFPQSLFIFNRRVVGLFFRINVWRDMKVWFENERLVELSETIANFLRILCLLAFAKQQRFLLPARKSDLLEPMIKKCLKYCYICSMRKMTLKFHWERARLSKTIRFDSYFWRKSRLILRVSENNSLYRLTDTR